MNEPSNDPIRDRALREALRAADPMPDDVDWARLHRSIEERAALPLARRRSRRRRPRWLRPMIPAAVAAGFAAVLGLQVLGPGQGVEPLGAESGISALKPMFEEVFGEPMSEAELDLLLGEVSADRLVLATLARP